MAALKDTSRLLNKAIALISKDLKHCSKLALEGKLPHDVAQDVQGYARTLLSFTDILESKKESEKKALGRMSTAELERLAKEVLK